MKDLVVISRIKEVAHAKKVNLSADAVKRMNEKVKWMIEDAAARAKANGRKTIKDSDL